MTESATDLRGELEPSVSPTQLLRDSIESQIHLVEDELGLIDRQFRQLSVKVEDCRERREQAETIRRLVLNNLANYGREEVDEAISAFQAAAVETAVAETRYEVLSEHQMAARDRLKKLRQDLDIALEAARDAAIRPPDQEAMTYRDASRQVFQLIEEERMRIARDMHDGPAQSMSNLVLQAEILERLASRGPDQMMAELQQFKSSVRAALEETRQLIFDLRPMTLDDLGLVPTLRKYTKEYGDKHGIITRFNVVGEERRLPSNIEGTLFRLIQEALTNVQKHARAQHAEVTLNLGKDRIIASVRDDGEGFDLARAQEALTRNRNLGLISMRERTELERGTLDIRSQPGKGTEIRVEFKLEG